MKERSECEHEWEILESKKEEGGLLWIRFQRIKCRKCELEEFRGFAKDKYGTIYYLNPDESTGKKFSASEALKLFLEKGIDEERKVKLLPEIPKPDLPVLFVSALGDEEGRTIKSFGYYNGEIEDILRTVAPKAIYAPASFGADYGVNIVYYKPREAYGKLERSPDEKPHIDSTIVYSPSNSPKEIKVAVRILSKEMANQFINRLALTTKYEIKRKTILLWI